MTFERDEAIRSSYLVYRLFSLPLCTINSPKRVMKQVVGYLETVRDALQCSIIESDRPISRNELRYYHITNHIMDDLEGHIIYSKPSEIRYLENIPQNNK